MRFLFIFLFFINLKADILIPYTITKAIALNDNSFLIATKNQLKLFKNNKEIQTITADKIKINDFAVSKNYIAIGGEDKVIRLLNKKLKLITSSKQHKYPIKKILIDEKNNLLISAGKYIIFWDLKSLHIIKKISFHTTIIDLAIYKNNLAIADNSNIIKIYNLKTEKTLYLKQHKFNVNAIDIKKDILVSGGDDSKIIIWNNFKPSQIYKFKKFRQILKLKIFKKYVLIGTNYGDFYIYDINLNKIIKRIKLRLPINNIYILKEKILISTPYKIKYIDFDSNKKSLKNKKPSNQSNKEINKLFEKCSSKIEYLEILQKYPQYKDYIISDIYKHLDKNNINDILWFKQIFPDYKIKLNIHIPDNIFEALKLYKQTTNKKFKEKIETKVFKKIDNLNNVAGYIWFIDNFENKKFKNILLNKLYQAYYKKIDDSNNKIHYIKSYILTFPFASQTKALKKRLFDTLKNKYSIHFFTLNKKYKKNKYTSDLLLEVDNFINIKDKNIKLSATELIVIDLKLLKIIDSNINLNNYKNIYKLNKILQKNDTISYKIENFKEALQNGFTIIDIANYYYKQNKTFKGME